jgi:hypothetical protein
VSRLVSCNTLPWLYKERDAGGQRAFAPLSAGTPIISGAPDDEMQSTLSFVGTDKYVLGTHGVHPDIAINQLRYIQIHGDA